MTSSSFPGSIKRGSVKHATSYEKIDISLDANGDANSDSLDGDIIKISYSKGTVDASTVATITTVESSLTPPL